MTPTERTLKLLRAEGYACIVVEHTVRIPRKPPQPPLVFKRDIWGVDILASQPGLPLLAVQTTTMAHLQARVDKLKHGLADKWTRAGVRVEAHGWRYLRKLKCWDVDRVAL